MFRFSTRSAYDEVNRAIQAKKFYATLPKKLDNAVEDCIEEMAIPEEPAAIIKEVGTFGDDGWSISKTASFVNNDDSTD